MYHTVPPTEIDLSAIVAPLLSWYDANARILPWRENTAPYRVWVSEIMLQQTRVEAVKPYYERFMQQLPTLQSLADAPEEELLKLWEGLGYYARVRNLQKAAQLLCGEFAGMFPESADQLLRLPGVGAYTAGAIASISFGQPVPAVDGNVLRVAARLTEDYREISNAAFKSEITAALAKVYPANRSGDFTQSLMELGAIVCTPGGAPKCAECPLAALCQARRSGTQLLLPAKAKKQPRRQQCKTVFLLSCADRIAVRKREDDGLLGGLWEFPNTEGLLTRPQARVWLEQAGLELLSIAEGGKKNHIFTHIEWRMCSYRAECRALNGAFTWVTQEALHSEITLPTAFRKFSSAVEREGPAE